MPSTAKKVEERKAGVERYEKRAGMTPPGLFYIRCLCGDSGSFTVQIARAGALEVFCNSCGEKLPLMMVAAALVKRWCR